MPSLPARIPSFNPSPDPVQPLLSSPSSLCTSGAPKLSPSLCGLLNLDARTPGTGDIPRADSGTPSQVPGEPRTESSRHRKAHGINNPHSHRSLHVFLTNSPQKQRDGGSGTLREGPRAHRGRAGLLRARSRTRPPPRPRSPHRAAAPSSPPPFDLPAAAARVLRPWGGFFRPGFFFGCRMLWGL